MGVPVVIAANGYGTPITVATNGFGLPVEIASNGIGMPVVLVASGGMPVVGSFGPDVTAPLAVSFSPTDNATSVNTATLLIVTFDSLVTLGTGNVTLKRTSDNATIEAWDVVTEAGTGAGQVSVEFSTQLTMRLTTSIAGGTEYYVIWDANVVKDVANNPVAANASTTLWSFTTVSSGYDAATEAIAAAFTTPPTTARKNLIDAAVVALKAAGVWAKLDALYLLAAADSQAGLVNWKAPGTYNGTLVNAPTFTADSGFTGGATKSIDTNFNPTTATTPQFIQNSATVFAWGLKTASGSGEVTFGSQGSSADSYIYPRETGDTLFYGLNTSGNAVIASTDGSGLFTVVRTGASAQQSYRNGVAIGAGSTIASTSPLNSKHQIMMRNGTNFYTGTVTCAGFGSQLDSTQQLALYNALNTYLAGVGAVSSYQAETNVIAAAFTTPPTTARKNLIDAAVVSLKSAGVWAKLDALYLFAAADSQAAKINWIAPGTYNASEVNAPVFTADQGFTGANPKYLDTGFAPATATTPKYTRNDASIFGWSLSDIVLAAGIVGYTTTQQMQIIPRNAATTTSYIVNATVATTPTVSDGLGLFTAVRTGASAHEIYKNGVSLGTAAQASTPVLSENFVFLKRTAAHWTGTCAAGGFGSQLSAAENTSLYNALRTYLTGVGVP